MAIVTKAKDENIIVVVFDDSHDFFANSFRANEFVNGIINQDITVQMEIRTHIGNIDDGNHLFEMVHKLCLN